MNDMNINAEVKNLEEILCGDKFFYSIPIYQRPYAWDKENVEELLGDLLNAYQTQKEYQYFCGSIVITQSEEFIIKSGGKLYRHDIIDGQQRITTFTIIACVIRDFFLKNIDDRTQKYVFESIEDRYEEQEPKIKLQTDTNKYTDFWHRVIKKIDLDILTNGDKYLENAKHIYKCLRKYIKDENLDIGDFVRWIYGNVVLAKIKCSNEDTAIEIFNILNDRGMSLNSVDIIKSTLIQKVENDCRKFFKTEWDKINDTLEHNKLKIDDMFYTYLNYCLPKTSRRTLHKELIPYFTDKSNFENIFDTINEIKEFNKAYIEIIKDSNDKHIYASKYLPSEKHRRYWTSILATSKFKNYEWHEELKKCLVSYYYKNWIGGGTISRVAQTSCNIIQKIKGKKDISEIKEEIEKSMERFDMEKLYSDNLGEKDVYHTNWIRPLLCMLEYRYKDDSNQNFIPLNQDLQIEHVLPKNPKQGEWQKINNTEREELTHCLGNLTLLSQRKNGQGSNDEYHKKIDTYMEKDGVATSFDITGQIPRDYPTEWTADTITERRESLINDINNMLKI